MRFQPRDFRHPLVADLAWCIGAAPLLAPQKDNPWQLMREEWFAETFEELLPWLRSLDDDPAPLVDWMVERPFSLLGKRFEDLLEFWFSQAPGFRLLARNVQLIRNGRTAGELDFIVELPDQGIWHLEVACKFYLLRHPSARWNAWVGVNTSDTLEKKMLHSRQQLALSSDPLALEWMSGQGIPSTECALLLKGCFFLPRTDPTNWAEPESASRHFPAGWWIRLEEVSSLPEGTWQVIPYERSLSCQARQDEPWLATRELIRNLTDHFRRVPYAVHVIHEDGTRGLVIR